MTPPDMITYIALSALAVVGWWAAGYAARRVWDRAQGRGR